MVNLNMDFSQRVVIRSAQLPWQASPARGVERKPLAREQRESGHATSIVRYAAGAQFARHTHPLGEEILVLSGVFSDETGDYEQGHYFRNPPGTQHAPFSKTGCTLLVKLCQFQANDTERVSIATRQHEWLAGQGGLQVMPLHSFETEHTALVRWPAGERFKSHYHVGGEEILVLSGEFRDEFGAYESGTWIRSPHMSRHCPFVEQETIIWVKTGHLALSADHSGNPSKVITQTSNDG